MKIKLKTAENFKYLKIAHIVLNILNILTCTENFYLNINIQ